MPAPAGLTSPERTGRDGSRNSLSTPPRPAGEAAASFLTRRPTVCSPFARLAARGAAPLQRELLVRHRLERHAVQRRHALPFDRGPVLRRRIPDMGTELPAGVSLLHPLHEAVARD